MRERTGASVGVKSSLTAALQRQIAPDTGSRIEL